MFIPREIVVIRCSQKNTTKDAKHHEDFQADLAMRSFMNFVSAPARASKVPDAPLPPVTRTSGTNRTFGK